MSDVKAKIGIILILGNFLVGFLWSLFMGHLFLMWYWSSQISRFTFATLGSGPSITLTSAGLAMYIAGRRIFWKVNRKRSVRMLVGIIGAILTILGGFFILGYYGTSLYLSGKHGPPWDKPLAYYLSNYFPYFITSVLWLISGILLLIDTSKHPAPKVMD